MKQKALRNDSMNSIDTNVASTMLKALSKYADCLRGGYAIAIYTVEGKLYTYSFEVNTEDDNERIYNGVRSDPNDPIRYIVCVIGKETAVDIPPYHMRKKLCEINEKNFDAEIFMQGEDGLYLKKMKCTLL